MNRIEDQSKDNTYDIGLFVWKILMFLDMILYLKKFLYTSCILVLVKLSLICVI